MNLIQQFKLQLTGILMLLLSFSQTFSQEKRIPLDHISNADGLSQNTIHSILQDKKGFIWFATEDGLNMYDGNKFTVFKNNPDGLSSSSSISDNFIWTMCEDRSGNLWIGTNDGGLSKFNREKGTFVNFQNDPSDTGSLSFNNVRAVFEDKEGILWIGTETGGLDKLDREKNTFVHHTHNPDNKNSLSNNVVLAVYEDDDGDLWIGSDGGLDLFDRKNNKFINYSAKNGLSSDVVLSIKQDKDGYLWIGTLFGLSRYDKKQKIFTKFINFNYPNANRINSILEDSEGVLWIGTGGGLFQLNRSNNKFYRITHSNSSLLINKNILSIYEDRSGLIWIGTAEDGAAKYDRERMKFVHFKHDPYSNSLSHNTVRSIYQEENGIVWVGTLGGGLNKLNLTKNKFTQYLNDPGNQFSLSDNSVSAIYKDSEGFLWVGTWNGGLNRSMHPVNSSQNDQLSFVRFRNGVSSYLSPSSFIVQAIFEDSQKNLWIGSGAGLNLFDKQNNKFISFRNEPANQNSISSNLIQSCILEDHLGNLWIGTWGGLNKLSALEKQKIFSSPSSVKFERFNFSPENKFSLSDNRVISALQDAKGNLWFGTYGGGLNKLSTEMMDSVNVQFKRFTIKEGLPSNIIYNIQSDSNGMIWLSTDNGLAMFDPEKEIFRNFNESDGLQGNQFYWGAGFKGNNNTLFFGGTNGFNLFHPEELKINYLVPEIVITDFTIFNKPVEVDAENSPLTKVISETEEIELPYSQNVFSFEFASLDFTAPEKNQYAYMMEGFDEDWIYSGNRRFVTYTNLNPGKYIFRVKGSNSDGIWNEKGAALTIEILPPLWQTWWFITLSVLLMGGIITFAIVYRVRYLLNIERFRARLAADLHDNIGSSLTEISIWSEIISKKIKNPDKDIEKSLQMISNNSRNLIDNMSDIVWLVNPKRDSLYDLILRLRDTYSELSSYTSISFKSENIKSLEKVSLSIEHRQHLYLIFKEAINNSITHSGCTEITLDAFVKGRKLEMVLSDNGKGFAFENLSNGNGLENIKSRAKLIGGTVHINSQNGKGTVIKFEGNIL